MAFINFDFDTEVTEVPDAAFADTGNPKTSEVVTWATTGKQKYYSIVWKGGTLADPTRVWLIGRSPTYPAMLIRGTAVAE